MDKNDCEKIGGKWKQKPKCCVLNPRSKSGIEIYIDKDGHKRWRFKSTKGAIYGKE